MAVPAHGHPLDNVEKDGEPGDSMSLADALRTEQVRGRHQAWRYVCPAQGSLTSSGGRAEGDGSRGENGDGSQRSGSSDDEGRGRAVGFPGVSGVGAPDVGGHKPS